MALAAIAKDVKERRVQLEQAIFTSVRGSQRQGYHLVSRSPGIDEMLAQRLTLWCPTHAALVTDGSTDESLNYFPVGDGCMALTRTVFGGPEYSGRGGLQVVTLVLLMRSEQLERYEGDALRVMRLALSLGYLRLPPTCPAQLPWVELPNASSIGIYNETRMALSQFLLDRAVRLLREQQRVALLGIANRTLVLQNLLQQLSKKQRMVLSFTTGLKPSLHRPFVLHLLPTDDRSLRQQLAEQDVYCLTA